MLGHLEKATLRPVPLRPSGPVDPAEAAAHVAAALPALDDHAARALALVEIAGRSRSEVADAIALEPEPLALALTRARKALRRSIFPLSASGWCERAERLISDRIDGELRAPGPRRLQVHLENCDRCVEHDRRLAQARDQLVRDFIDRHPHAEVAPLGERAAAGLRVVPAVVEMPAPVPEGPAVPAFGGPAPDPVLLEAAGELPAPTFSGPDDGWTPPPAEPRAEAVVEPAMAEPEPVAVEPEPVVEVPADPPPIERDIAPAEPADATPSESDAEPEAEPPVDEAEAAAEPEPPVPAEAPRVEAVAEPVVAAPGPVAAEPEPVAAAEATPVPLPTPLRSPGGYVWAALYGVAILFAVLTIVLLVLALAGVERVI